MSLKWAAMGLLMRGAKAVGASRDELMKALDDAAPAVRIAVAEALGTHGDDAAVKKSLTVLLELSDPEKNGAYVAIEALNALDNLGSKAAGLVEAVKTQCPDAHSESFVPPTFTVPADSTGGRVSFTDSGIEATDDGQPLLVQAENAGLTPESGCRMGICHRCTRRKTSGAVRNLITGAVSTADEEDVQICVSAPVGDVEIAL